MLTVWFINYLDCIRFYGKVENMNMCSKCMLELNKTAQISIKDVDVIAFLMKGTGINSNSGYKCNYYLLSLSKIVLSKDGGA